MGRAPGCWVSGHPREPEVGRGVARRRMLTWPCMATGNGALGPLGSGPTAGLRGSGWQRREGKLAAPGNLGLTAGGWAHRGFPSTSRMVNLESVHAGKGHWRKDRAGAHHADETWARAGNGVAPVPVTFLPSFPSSSLLLESVTAASAWLRASWGMDAALALFRGLPSHAHSLGALLRLPAPTWVVGQSTNISWAAGKWAGGA